MRIARGAGSRTVSLRGAAAGSVLCGSGLNNQGLRIRVTQEQVRGNGGPVQGEFVILNVGDNIHSDSLTPLLNKSTTAAEVVRVIRQRHAGCVSVANTNILLVELPDAAC